MMRVQGLDPFRYVTSIFPFRRRILALDDGRAAISGRSLGVSWLMSGITVASS